MYWFLFSTNDHKGTSLNVQWLRLCFCCGEHSSNPGQETRSQHSQKKKKANKWAQNISGLIQLKYISIHAARVSAPQSSRDTDVWQSCKCIMEPPQFPWREKRELEAAHMFSLFQNSIPYFRSYFTGLELIVCPCLTARGQ